MTMPVITRHEINDVLGLLGLADRHVESLTLHQHGVTVKQWLTDKHGRMYWDAAFDGPAYAYYTVLYTVPVP